MNEDIALENSWRALFNWLMENEPGFAAGNDVDLQLRGLSGLMSEEEATRNRQAVMGLVMQGVDRGSIPKQVEEYVTREALEAAGIPATQLGMDNQILDYASAQALNMPAAPILPGGQIPQLDARSNQGMPQGAVLTPSGTEQGAV